MTENKYLVKICALLKPPQAPRSERAVKKRRLVHKPKLHKFTTKIDRHNKVK